MRQRHTAAHHHVHVSLYELEGRIDALFKELMRDSVIIFLNYGLMYINKLDVHFYEHYTSTNKKCFAFGFKVQFHISI